MGAHSVKDGGRAARIAGRGLLSATAALALLGGGAGVALAGEASHGTSHDADHRDHDKGDKHDGKGKHHEKDRDKDRDDDGPKCEVEEAPELPLPGLDSLIGSPEPECDDDDVVNPELPGGSEGEDPDGEDPVGEVPTA